MMTDLTEEIDQPNAPSANGKSAPFEGEDVGSIPTGASRVAPIDCCNVVPVPGKEFTFMLVDKVTGEPFNVAAEIERQFNAGQCAGK